MKKTMAGLLSSALILSCSIPAFAVAPSEFPDFDGAAWHGRAMTYVVEEEIMHGTDQGLLEPNRPITRAEFVTLVDNLFRTYRKADISAFSDMPEDAWHYGYISMGYQMGTISGMSGSTMEPNANISREQAMTVLARALALQEGTAKDLAEFADVGDVSTWAVPYVAAMVKEGRTNGFPDSTLRPRQNITRAETAQLLMNCFPVLSGENLINKVNTDTVYVLRVDADSKIENSVFQDALILTNGLAEHRVDIYNSDINRLVCWGSRDIYLYPGCSVNEIVLARTDGPCIIHWMGDSKKLPNVIFRDSCDEGCKVVDSAGNQLLPKTEGTSEGGIWAPMVYFDPQNGTGIITRAIQDGLIQPPKAPVREGYVFGGWYLDKACESRFSFTQKVKDGLTLYGRWYTPEEWERVQELNDIVTGATARVQAETDLMATIGETTIPCSIFSAAENPKTVTVELVRTDTNEVVARAAAIQPGETATVMQVVGQLPEFGNYKAKLVVTPKDETGHFDIEAMLYVAYLWDRGE